jgi:hypothetical protein
MSKITIIYKKDEMLDPTSKEIREYVDLISQIKNNEIEVSTKYRSTTEYSTELAVTLQGDLNKLENAVTEMFESQNFPDFIEKPSIFKNRGPTTKDIYHKIIGYMSENNIGSTWVPFRRMIIQN